MRHEAASQNLSWGSCYKGLGYRLPLRTQEPALKLSSDKADTCPDRRPDEQSPIPSQLIQTQNGWSSLNPKPNTLKSCRDRNAEFRPTLRVELLLDQALRRIARPGLRWCRATVLQGLGAEVPRSVHSVLAILRLVRVWHIPR